MDLLSELGPVELVFQLTFVTVFISICVVLLGLAVKVYEWVERFVRWVSLR